MSSDGFVQHIHKHNGIYKPNGINPQLTSFRIGLYMQSSFSYTIFNVNSVESAEGKGITHIVTKLIGNHMTIKSTANLL